MFNRMQDIKHKSFYKPLGRLLIGEFSSISRKEFIEAIKDINKFVNGPKEANDELDKAIEELIEPYVGLEKYMHYIYRYVLDCEANINNVLYVIDEYFRKQTMLTDNPTLFLQVIYTSVLINRYMNYYILEPLEEFTSQFHMVCIDKYSKVYKYYQDYSEFNDYIIQKMLTFSMHLYSCTKAGQDSCLYIIRFPEGKSMVFYDDLYHIERLHYLLGYCDELKNNDILLIALPSVDISQYREKEQCKCRRVERIDDK